MIFIKYHHLKEGHRYAFHVVSKEQKIDETFKTVGAAEIFLLQLNKSHDLKIEAFPSYDEGLTYDYKRGVRLY
ncbi:MAG: hypothetical protein ABII18_00245 [bacterium]